MPVVPIKEIIVEGGYEKEHILTLCEVYVFACLPSQKGLDNCRNFCTENCKIESICTSITSFSCPSCTNGWTGPYCTQRILPVVTCNRPNIPYAAIIQPNQQTYRYNETVTFSCIPGFKLVGEPIRRCQQSGHFMNLPSCTGVTCNKPIIPYAAIIQPNQQTYRYNEAVTFSCSPGFRLIGQAVRRCQQNGQFGNLPSCTGVTCNKPIIPYAAIIQPNQQTYRYNEAVTFSCSPGFRLIGQAVRRCQQNGQFGNLPSCTGVTCNKPIIPYAAIIQPNQQTYRYNEAVTFSCSPGFRLIGQALRRCQQNGQFGNLPSCTVVTCSRPKIPNAMIHPEKGTYEYNETVRFSCALGFSLIGAFVKSCQQDGHFEGNLPSCTEVECTLPNIDQKLLVSPNKTKFHYNKTVEFQCEQGYELIGQHNATCQQNRSFGWMETLPRCDKVKTETSSSVSKIVGSIVGSAGILAIIGIVVFFVIRKRSGKRADSYKNEALSLDSIDDDHQYAEVKTRNPNKNNPVTPKQEDSQENQANTYYNMNSTNVEKAKEARQEVYYEFSPLPRTFATAVPVSDFKMFVENKKADPEFFEAQFKKFYTGLQYPATAAVLPENRAKNKYKNIYPYDETRVHLKKGNGSKNSDYINASFIHGYGSVKSYIAAQGPLINTIDDFWRMMWNENCEKIVMLTNLFEDEKVKCIQYWPDEDKLETGSMRLEVVEIETFAEFTIRTFNLINGNEQRLIRQFHFTAWPDKGVPSYASSLVHFRSKVIHTHENRKGPMVVHCSAGIGRTGTFIALDYLVHQANESGYVDVFECVETLRRQRLNMVQTLEQYKFVHEALLEALMCTSSDPSSAEFPQIYKDLLKVDDKTGKRNIDVNFENLGSGFSSLPESVYSFAKNPTNKKKNRYSNILPVDSEMPQLRDNENNPIYINAVFLPAYKTKRSFIATQMPLQETVVDFWQLLYEQKVSTIVMLNQTKSKESKENIGIYWPDQLNAVKEYGPFRVTRKSDTEEDDFKRIDLSCCKEEDGEEERKLRLFQCTFWADSSTVPSSVLKFLKLINAVELHHDRNNTGPLVVHCMNGAEKTGLFCVLQVVLERMKIEQDVAIHHVIKQLRSIRPSIIPNVEQFKFCHDVVLEFLKQYDAYSNFQ
uniref:protein-tyrosine-phosphatase n=1 Tax=Crassostrea virginica TaxID=6565 RepID=A0A8B8CLM7_CRAVI|nr:receptor-type tyrosine-protein phosphatase kappa-like [Crassostrea virginica]